MINPASINISHLPTMPLKQRSKLPSVAAIYFALSPEGVVLYIGKAEDLKTRWRSHHRELQFNKINGLAVAWLEISDINLLLDIEAALIAYFNPPLNGRPVEGGPLLIRLTDKQRAKLEYYCLTKEIPLSEGVRELVRNLPDPPADFLASKLSKPEVKVVPKAITGKKAKAK